MKINTAHRREVGDLIAAGLNPILAVNKGAATGAGAQAVMSNPQEGVASAINTARSIDEVAKQQLHNEAKRISNETDLKNATVLTKRSERELMEAQTEQAQWGSIKNMADSNLASANYSLTEEKERTERYMQAYIKAQELEKKSNIDLNSALKLQALSTSHRTDLQSKLHEYDVGVRGFNYEMEKWTTGANRALDTVEKAADLANPTRRFLPRRP